MKLHVSENYEIMSQNAARFIIKTIQENPQGLYCFAGGDTPVRTLQLLVEAHHNHVIDLTQAYYIELDEWVGLDQDNPGSCLSYLKNNLFIPANIPSDHIHAFNTQAENMNDECLKANQYIEFHNGLTLTLLGVGVNGHLGFNEPGVSIDNNAHIIDLDETTKSVGQKYFSNQEILSQGVTLGIKQLMASKFVVVEANGKKKHHPIERVIRGDIDTMCPVTIINTHPQSHLFIDNEAKEG
ncbi:MAG: glucosamine-6-phosphate deaminase [Coprobacillus sp.]